MTPKISLRSGDSAALVTPRRGGVMQSLRFCGKELLAQMPWEPEPIAELMDEPAWVKSWSGGWQLLVPNAGGAAHGVIPAQGFHGNASVAEWQSLATSDSSCDLRWSEEGLEVVRHIELQDNTVVTTTAVTNHSSIERPLIATEHLILGAEALATDGLMVCSDQAQVTELDYDGSPGRHSSLTWAEAGLAEVSSDTPGRLFVISDAGNDGIGYLTSGISVRLCWDTNVLPFMWLWEEVGATSDAPWNREVRALGLEPSTTDHGLGLDYELNSGRARFLAPGARLDWWISLEMFNDKE